MKKFIAIIMAILSIGILCFVGCDDPYADDYDPDNGNQSQGGGNQGGGGNSGDDDDSVELPYVPFN